MNYYKILESNPNDSLDAIKKSYKRLVKKYHPDLNPGSNYDEKIKEINHAYSMIVDSHGKNTKIFPDKESYKKSEYTNPEDGIFRGPKNKDVNIEYKLSVDDLLHAPFDARISYSVEGGRTQKLDITIPSGLNFGDTIIYRRKGYFENYCQPAGDVYIKIVEDRTKESKFKTSKTGKLDIEMEIKISYLDIIIGSVNQILCPDKTMINVTLPKEFTPETKIRLSEKGIKDTSKMEVGDLILSFQLCEPKLSEEQLTCLKLVRNSIDLNL